MAHTNALSALGRMTYGAHLFLYPLIGGSVYYTITNYRTNAAAAAKKLEWEMMPKAKAVDPDVFHPFSAIPFHNNPELKYRYADMNLHGYIDKKTQMNLKDYVYKNYHDSYDHDTKKTYMYNWVSMVPSDDVALFKQ